MILVDAGSHDGTVAAAKRFAGVRVLRGERPVARGRNLGGRSASGDVVIFLDADTRLPEALLERFVWNFTSRNLDVACPLYVPHDSTPAVERFHRVFNLLTRTFQDILPCGAGICLAVEGGLFRRSRGFDPDLKFDDIGSPTVGRTDVAIAYLPRAPLARRVAPRSGTARRDLSFEDFLAAERFEALTPDLRVPALLRCTVIADVQGPIIPKTSGQVRIGTLQKRQV